MEFRQRRCAAALGGGMSWQITAARQWGPLRMAKASFPEGLAPQRQSARAQSWEQNEFRKGESLKTDFLFTFTCMHFLLHLFPYLKFLFLRFFLG